MGPIRLAPLALAITITIAPNASAQPQPSARAAPGELKEALAAGDAAPTPLGQYGDWAAYTLSGNEKVCYAFAKPIQSTTDPPNRPRGRPYMFISSRPAANVKDEVSVIFGYAFKSNSDATIEIAETSYLMHTQKTGAWTKNAADEPRLLAALLKGTEAVVKGISLRGTTSIDTYSLRGLPEALARARQECK